MNDEITTTRKRQRHMDRITLDVAAQERVDAWILQVVGNRKGVSLGRKDIVNWLINGRDEILTRDEATELAARHFNKKRFLRQALKELNQAMSEGVDVSLDELLASGSAATSNAPRRKRRRRVTEPTDAEASPLIDAAQQTPTDQ